MTKLEACLGVLKKKNTLGEISLKKDHTYYTRCLINILGIVERLLGVRQWNHSYEDITTQGSE